jgi:hypothetical protein
LVDDCGVGQHDWRTASATVGTAGIARFEGTNCFISAKIDKVLSGDCQLGVTVERTAWRLNFPDFWAFVVKEWDSGGVEASIDLDDELDLAWCSGSWRTALDLGA